MQRQLELLRLHNSSLNLHGQIIRARVIDMDRKKILIDTGLKIAKIAHSDITDECIIGTTNPEDDDEPRRPGALCVRCSCFGGHPGVWCLPASSCCWVGQCASACCSLQPPRTPCSARALLTCSVAVLAALRRRGAHWGRGAGVP